MEIGTYIIVSIVFIVHGKWLYGGKFSFGEGIVFLSLLSIMFFGQLMKDHNLTYPVTHWSMYSSANPAASYYEYIIETNDGERLHYPFSIITRISPRAFMKKIEEMDWKFSEPKESGSNTKYLIDDTVKSLIAIYSQKNPGHEIKRFEINGFLFQRNNVGSNKPEKYNYYTYTVD